MTLACFLAGMSSQAMAGGLDEPRPQEIPFHEVDRNSNCYLDEREFTTSFRTPGNAFGIMDRDGDGRISKVEARETYAEYRERYGMNTPDPSEMRIELPSTERLSMWASFKQTVAYNFERRCTDWEKIKERQERRKQDRDDRDDRDGFPPEPPVSPEQPDPQPEPDPEPTPDPEPEDPWWGGGEGEPVVPQ